MNTVYIVGIGPGEYKKMTIEAVDILKKCENMEVNSHVQGKKFCEEIIELR